MRSHFIRLITYVTFALSFFSVANITQALSPNMQVAAAKCVNIPRTLTIGSEGKDVMSLQNYLIGQGYLSVGANGHFGPLTKSAVKKWQIEHGILAVGSVGPRTRAAMRCGSQSTSSTIPTSQSQNNSVSSTTQSNGLIAPTGF